MLGAGEVCTSCIYSHGHWSSDGCGFILLIYVANFFGVFFINTLLLLAGPDTFFSDLYSHLSDCRWICLLLIWAFVVILIHLLALTWLCQKSDLKMAISI